MKKLLKWLLPAVGALAALAVGIWLLDTGEEPVQQTPQPSLVIGWNIERANYISDDGFTSRGRSGDYYRAKFAIEGVQRDLLFPDYDMMFYADSMDFVGLEITEEGVVSRVVPVNEFTGGIIFENYYVRAVGEDSVTCGLLMTRTAPAITLPINEKTQVYDVGGSGILCGVASTLEPGARIWAVLDYDGAVQVAFVANPTAKQPVYWNMKRMYNSTTQLTTRESDALGVFTYDFAVNGEQVQLKTREFDVACEIDSIATRCMALTFDEEGYITRAQNAKLATGGLALASWFHVTELTDEGFSAQKMSGSDKGKTAKGILSSDCKIFDVSGSGEDVGKPTTLRLYDQIHCQKDAYGDVCIIFVIKRFETGDIYWNLERKYENNATSRWPDKDGWYYIKMAHNGKREVLKTKDKAIVDWIDSVKAKCVALDVEGDVIVSAYSTGKTIHGISFCSWAVVKSISKDGYIIAKTSTKKSEGYLAEDFVAYDVSNMTDNKGEKTTLRLGDKIHALKNLDGTVSVAFIVDRAKHSSIYWNISRKYDSTNKVTNRTPDENGWYYIDFAVDGEQKTLKTKDQKVATAVDAISTRTMGLRVSGDVIKDVYTYTSLEGYTGSIGGWFTVTDIQGTKVTLEDKRSSSDTFGKVYEIDIPEETPVYNVSSTYESHLGEKSAIQLGDQIFTLRNGTKSVHVFIISRSVLRECIHCNETVFWKEWSGSAAFENGGHYYLKEDVTQTAQLRIGEGNTGCLDLNGHNIAIDPEAGRAFNIYGTLNLMGEGTITASNDAITMASVFYVQKTGTLNMHGGTLTSLYATPRAGIGIIQGNMNMYDGTITGGKSTGNGGNLEIMGTGTLTVYGGTISNGTAAALGGNIYVTGVLKLLGGTVTGGTAAEGGGIHSKTNVTLGGTASVKGNTDTDLYLASGKQVIIEDTLIGESTIGIALESGTVFSNVVAENTEKVFFHNGEGTVIRNREGQLQIQLAGAEDPEPETHTHCICGGSYDHTHADVQWEPWTGTWESGKYYYLTGDVTNFGTLTVNADQTLNLCLNGHTITGKTSTSRMLRIYGTVNLCDHKQDGNFAGGVVSTYAGTATSLGHVFYVFEGGAFNLYGGNLTAKGTSEKATVGIVYKGQMFLYDGTVTGGNSISDGGNLAVFSTGKLTMYGGQLSGGKTQGSGGNLYIQAAGRFTMLGGIITGGSAAQGGGVMSKANVTLGGSAVISGNTGTDLMLAEGKKVIVQEFTGEKTVGIALESGTVFTDAVAEGVEKAFFANGDYTVIRNTDGCLELQQKQGEDPNAHKHCICGGSDDHTHTEVEWEPWTGSWESGKYYYLTENLTGWSSLKITAGQTLNLCLNGHSITSGAYRAFDVAGTLNICDHKKERGFAGTITDTLAGTATSLGHAVRVTDGGVFNLYGGNITATGTANQGAVIPVTDPVYVNDLTFTVSGDLELTHPLTLVSGKEGGTLTVSRGDTVLKTLTVNVEEHNHCVCSGAADHECQEVQWQAWTGAWESGGYYYLTKDVTLGQVVIPAGQTLNLCLNGYDITSATYQTFKVSGTLNICDHKTEDGYVGTVTNTYAGTTNDAGTYTSTGHTIYVGNGGVCNLYGGSFTATGTGRWGTVVAVTAGGTMNLYDGKLYGGNAENGGNVVIMGRNSDNVSATLNMYGGQITGGTAEENGDNLYVQSGYGKLYLYGGSITDGSVYSTANVTMSKDAYVEDLQLLDGKKVTYVHLAHCVCCGNGAGKGSHSCTDVTWEPWTGEWFSGGCYYLTEDLTSLAQVKVTADTSLTLCLNGYSITSSAYRAFDIYGTLNLCDHETYVGFAGTITDTYAGTATSLGHALRVNDGGVFNLYGGNLTATGTGNQGTVIAVIKGGTMNLYDGKIYGGNAASNGGNVLLQQTGKLYMYGGQITGGEAAGNGGNVFVHSANGTFEMYGGSITGGEAASGSGVYSNANVLMGMDARIENNIDTNLVLADGKHVSFDHSTAHCVCGGSATGVGAHNCEAVTWEPWTGEWVSGGHYYLTGDLTSLAQVKVTADTSLTLCLNGYSITSSAYRAFLVDGTLNICDHKVGTEYFGSFTDTYAGTDSSMGHLAYVRNNGAMNIYGGNLTATGTAKNGCVIAVNNNAVVTLYDGVIYGGDTTGHGGNVAVISSACLNMYGGQISGGTSATNGGNVSLNNAASTFKMYGGSITGGEAQNGGNVGTGVASTVLLSGGQLANGTATANGGNLYALKATIEDMDIQNGTATDNGGSVWINGTASITDSVLTGGNSTKGGAVFLGGSADCTVTGSTVQTGTGTTGRVIYISSGSSLSLKDSAVNDLSYGATCIWNVGTLTLQGNVTINKEDKDALDIMVDARNESGAVIDISGLTGQDATFKIRRWEDGNTETTGLVATGADAEDLYRVFRASVAEYAISYADGKLYLANAVLLGRDAAGNQLIKYASIEDALADTVTQGVCYYQAKQDLSGVNITKAVLIDLAGNDWTDVSIAEGVEVVFIDSATDDYDCSDGYGKVTLAEGSLGTVAAKASTREYMSTIRSYVTLSEGGVYSFHRYYAAITAMSLKPANAALGFKATFCGDDMVKAAVTSFGYNLWIEGSSVKTCAMNGEMFENGKIVTLRVQNILSDNAALSQIGASAVILGNSFITFNNGLNVTSTTQETSLRNMLERIDGLTDTFEDEQLQAVQTMCQTYAQYMEGWNIDNIMNWPYAPLAYPDYTQSEGATTKQLRQTAVKAMTDMLSVHWTVDQTYTYEKGSTNAGTYTYKPGFFTQVCHTPRQTAL